MKFALFVFAFICICLCFHRAKAVTEFSELSATDLDGNNVSFEKYKNKCVMVVNTGSSCGLTNPTMNYLNQLTNDPEYAGLAIVAFPSNHFNQEKKSREELKEWFKSWYAKYDVYDKIEFETSEVYQFLYKQAGNVYPKWNYGMLQFFSFFFKLNLIKIY